MYYFEDPAVRVHKKQRTSTACDGCRKRKIKCDSSQYPGSRCSNCIDFGIECTYCQPTKKRGPKSKYVESLEAKIKALMKKNSARSYQSSQASHISETTSSTDEDNHDLSYVELTEQLNSLQMNPVKERYFGPDSLLMIFKIVMSKAGVPPLQHPLRRPQYWTEPPWERMAESQASYVFPDCDLADSLISIYFFRLHPHYPILHEHSFRQSYREGKHFGNKHFAAVFLLVCAIASAYSDDPRVLSMINHMGTYEGVQLSGGWQWYEQVQTVRKNLFNSASMEELQVYALSALFLIGSSAPHAALHIVSIGMRFSEDLGLHRRKPDGHKLTAEDEIMKRNFWVLLCFERIMCSFLGRSNLLRDSDIDADLPVECDDQYWNIPTDPSAPVQFNEPVQAPPSSIMAFNQLITLCRVLVKTKKVARPFGDHRDRETVVQLNSSLTEWLDSVPDHLRWSESNPTSQSAALFSLYYLTQIQIYRPFIQTSSPLALSATATCANAARSCSFVLESQVKGAEQVVFLHTLISSFAAGAILVLIMHERPEDTDVESVKRCMDVLKNFENRWHGAGRLWDMLNLMISTWPLFSSGSASGVMYPTQMGNIDPEHSLYQMLAFYSGR